MSHVEVHYHRAWFYAALGSVAVLLICGAAAISWRADSWLSAVSLAAVGASCAGALLVFGRLVINVHDGMLRIRCGWVPLIQRTLPVDALTHVRACVLPRNALAVGWGLAPWPGAPRRYGTGLRRAVEFTFGGRQHVITTRRPADLKAALLGEAIEKPRRRAHAPSVTRHRHRRSANTWALIRPQDVRRANDPL